LNKITDVNEAAKAIHAVVKSAKKAQAKKGPHAACRDLASHVYAVRNGEPEVVVMCEDDAIRTAFDLCARVFNGDIVVVGLDGRVQTGERRHMLTVAVDRMGGLGFVQQFYDTHTDGLELDKPITTGKPSFLKKRVQKGMHESMQERPLTMPKGLVSALAEFEQVDASPVAMQAFTDLAVSAMLNDTGMPLGITSVGMITDGPDSPRAVALTRPGLPIFK
jgi:hypothetical protein